MPIDNINVAVGTFIFQVKGFLNCMGAKIIMFCICEWKITWLTPNFIKVNINLLLLKNSAVVKFECWHWSIVMKASVQISAATFLNWLYALLVKNEIDGKIGPVGGGSGSNWSCCSFFSSSSSERGTVIGVCCWCVKWIWVWAGVLETWQVT